METGYELRVVSEVILLYLVIGFICYLCSLFVARVFLKRPIYRLLILTILLMLSFVLLNEGSAPSLEQSAIYKIKQKATFFGQLSFFCWWLATLVGVFRPRNRKTSKSKQESSPGKELES